MADLVTGLDNKQFQCERGRCYGDELQELTMQEVEAQGQHRGCKHPNVNAASGILHTSSVSAWLPLGPVSAPAPTCHLAGWAFPASSYCISQLAQLNTPTLHFYPPHICSFFRHPLSLPEVPSPSQGLSDAQRSSELSASPPLIFPSTTANPFY